MEEVDDNFRYEEDIIELLPLIIIIFYYYYLGRVGRRKKSAISVFTNMFYLYFVLSKRCCNVKTSQWQISNHEPNLTIASNRNYHPILYRLVNVEAFQTLKTKSNKL